LAGDIGINHIKIMIKLKVMVNYKLYLIDKADFTIEPYIKSLHFKCKHLIESLYNQNHINLLSIFNDFIAKLLSMFNDITYKVLE